MYPYNEEQAIVNHLESSETSLTEWYGDDYDWEADDRYEIDSWDD